MRAVSESESVRISAAEAILDRAWGRPLAFDADAAGPRITLIIDESRKHEPRPQPKPVGNGTGTPDGAR